MADDAEPQVSQQERERVVEELRRHMSEGRLDLQEFEDRAGRVYDARTVSELRPVVADLPVPERVGPPGPTPPGPTPAAGGVPLMSIPAFRTHFYLWLVFSAFFIVLWMGTVFVSGEWIPFWPVFPISAFGLSVGIHAAARKGAGG
jgi:Domain of unknown function (DUF1707)